MAKPNESDKLHESNVPKEKELQNKANELNEFEANLDKRLESIQYREDSLIKQRETLQKTENEISKRREAIQKTEEDLIKQNADTQKKQDDLLKQYESIQKAKREIVDRENKVKKLEIDAQAGFMEQQQKFLEPLQKEYQKLQQSIQVSLETMNSDIVNERTKLYQKMEIELQSERTQREKEMVEYEKKRRESLEKELVVLREQHKQQLELLEKQVRERLSLEQKEYLKEREAISNQKDSLQKEQAKWREEMKQHENSLQQKEIALAQKDKQNKMLENILEEDKKLLETKLQQRIKEATDDAQQEILRLKDRIRLLQEELTKWEFEYNRLQDTQRRFGDKLPQDVLKNQQLLENENNKLRQELAQRPSVEDKQRLAVLLQEQRKWQEEKEILQRNMITLQSKVNNQLLSTAELEEQRNLYELEKRRREVLSAESDKLRADIARLRSLYEQPKEIAARKGVIEEPYFKDIKRDSLGNIMETKWLDRICENLEKSGFFFPKRLIYAFHTALKTSEWAPLAVLAGVSGTGKSELPRLYARFGGIVFLPLPVQPNWDSPQSLFGFFNSVDNRFNATPLVRAMAQSYRKPEDKSGLNDLVLLVLLDEMNLAHIELYFSDLLSKLELRRGESKNISIEIDLGAGLEKHPIVLGKNILWAGTMNEDETTKSLSDKVLDRGNILYFPRPKEFKRREKLSLEPEQPMLPLATWKSWQRTQSIFTPDIIKLYKERVEEINKCLEKVGRALGHRVWQSIEYYMSNYPNVLESFEKSSSSTPQAKDKALLESNLKKAMDMAFEDQLVQKVMPKLRGIETTGDSRKKCLEPISKLLEEWGLHLTEDFKYACNIGYGSFIWGSARYLEINE